MALTVINKVTIVITAILAALNINKVGGFAAVATWRI